MYRFVGGKLIMKGSNIKPIEEIKPPVATTEVPKPKPKTDKEIIEEIKKIDLKKNHVDSAQALEKRLKKFVEFKI